MAFSGFLRVGEFTYSAAELAASDFSQWQITVGSVVFRDSITLTLPASKTEPFCTEVTLYLPIMNDIACPQAALCNMLPLLPSPFSHSSLFQRSENHPFSREYVINSLRALLSTCRIPGHFSGHSFRHGVAKLGPHGWPCRV
jgi:hypothetical protein